MSGTGVDAIALAEELALEFGERAGEVDREGRFPHENIARLKETGYLKLPLPVELGGAGADLATVCRAQSILARGCASTALATNMHLFGLGAAAETVADGEEEARMVLQLAVDRRGHRGLVHRRRNRAERPRVVDAGGAGRGRVQDPRSQGVLLARTRARRLLRHRGTHRRQRPAPLRHRPRGSGPVVRRHLGHDGDARHRLVGRRLRQRVRPRVHGAGRHAVGRVEQEQ